MNHLITLYLTLYIQSISSQLTITDLNDLATEIREEIDASGNNRKALATIVRLIWHDCAGPMDIDDNSISICNGCIDSQNDDHAGLENGAISVLEDVYQFWETDINRADFWAFAATVAVEYGQELDEDNPNDSLPTIPYYIGREECPTSPDANNTKQFPSGLWGWNDVSSWFDDNLNFSDREIVAILGAHTLGKAHSQFSGFSSERWKRRGPDRLNNEFYQNLFTNDYDHTPSPTGLYEWTTIEDGREILMLNTDMCLFIDIDDYLDLENNGFVNCPNDGCPDSEVKHITQEFANDNQLWLNEFAYAFEKLITTGYNVSELTIIGNRNDLALP